MENKLVLRVQSRAGRFVLDSLDPHSTLWDLQQLVERETGIHPDSQKVLCGYPPKELGDYRPAVTLCELHFKSGENIIISELTCPRTDRADPSGNLDRDKHPPEASVGSGSGQVTEERTGTSSQPPDGAEGQRLNQFTSGRQREETGRSGLAGGEGERPGASVMGTCTSLSRPKLVRKVVPADNSCLFRCISYLMSEGRDSPSELRQLAAGVILSHPHRYSEAVLGRPPDLYVQWLLKDQSWGGAIELSVFSEYYGVELDVVDVQTQRIDRFGEASGFEDRALLVYDGIHYDPLVLQSRHGAAEQKLFPTSDTTILSQASQLAQDAFLARQFTDVGGFSLRCLACGGQVRGQREAQAHAMATGHCNFGEI